MNFAAFLGDTALSEKNLKSQRNSLYHEDAPRAATEVNNFLVLVLRLCVPFL